MTVANVESKAPENIVSGNEKVVRPRLTSNLSLQPLTRSSRSKASNERLRNVVFQAQLESCSREGPARLRPGRLHRRTYRRQCAERLARRHPVQV
ncbi:hypothetical protein ACPA9J_24515 [Pseudomonas aeruginosa]